MRWPSRDPFRWQEGIPPGQHEMIHVQIPWEPKETDRIGVGLAEQSHRDMLFHLLLSGRSDKDGPKVGVSAAQAREYAKNTGTQRASILRR